MTLFAVLKCELNSETKMIFLTCFLETQATGRHRSLRSIVYCQQKLTYGLRGGDFG